MAETPPAPTRAARGRGGARSTRKAGGAGRGGARAAAAAAATAAAEHATAIAAQPSTTPAGLPSTTPMMPPPTALYGAGAQLAAEGSAGTSNEATLAAHRRAPPARNRRSLRRAALPSSSSENDDAQELDLPEDNDPPRPDELDHVNATSFSRRLWQVIANSPRWIREQGRGSGSDSDSEPEMEVLRQLYQRRRVDGPYWLRPDVHAPNRLTYQESRQNRRRGRIRLGNMQGGEFPQISGSDYSEDDDDGEDEDRNDRLSDGDYMENEQDRELEDGAGAFGDEWGGRAADQMDDFEPEMERFTQLTGLDSIPPDAEFEDIARLLPKQTVWRRFRRGFRNYVRKPGLRLLKWIALRLLFLLFAVYWIIKEVLVFSVRISWRLLRDFAWKPLVKVLSALLTGPIWIVSNILNGLTSLCTRVFGSGVSPWFIILLTMAGGYTWLGAGSLSGMLSLLPEPRLPTFRLPDLSLPLLIPTGSGMGGGVGIDHMPVYTMDTKLEADLVARLNSLELSMANLLRNAQHMQRERTATSNEKALSMDTGAFSDDVYRIRDEIDAILLRLGVVEARGNSMNEDMRTLHNAAVPKKAIQQVHEALTNLMSETDTLRDQLATVGEQSNRTQERIDTFGRHMNRVSEELTSVKRRQSELVTAASTASTPSFTWRELEEHLANRLPAQFLSSGELHIDDALKRYLNDWLEARGNSRTTAAAPRAEVDWSQLLGKHRDDLNRLINDRVARLMLDAKAHGDLMDRDAVLGEIRRHDLQEGTGWQGFFGGAPSDKPDQVQATVRRELDRFQADRLAVADYALLAGGARVVPGLTSDTYMPGMHADMGRVRRAAWWLLNLFKPTTAKPPSIALMPWQQPGDCWPMVGRSGHLTVYLARSIIPEAITLEHVDRRIALNANSSPKDIIVFAVAHQIPDNEKRSAAENAADTETDPTATATGTDQQQQQQQQQPRSKWRWDSKQKVWTRPLIQRTYQLDGPAAQTWPIPPNAVDAFPVRMIQLRIRSNYGQPEFTCLYRLRVHGRVPTASATTSTAKTDDATS